MVEELVTVRTEIPRQLSPHQRRSRESPFQTSDLWGRSRPRDVGDTTGREELPSSISNPINRSSLDFTSYGTMDFFHKKNVTPPNAQVRSLGSSQVSWRTTVVSDVERKGLEACSWPLRLNNVVVHE